MPRHGSGPRPEAVTAWVSALDAACDTACRHQGRAAIDATTALTPDQHRFAWGVAGSLAAGVTALAEACLRLGVDWAEVLDLARQERDDGDQSRPPD
jgi:hypothetical protein